MQPEIISDAELKCIALARFDGRDHVMPEAVNYLNLRIGATLQVAGRSFAVSQLGDGAKEYMSQVAEQLAGYLDNMEAYDTPENQHLYKKARNTMRAFSLTPKEMCTRVAELYNALKLRLGEDESPEDIFGGDVVA